MQKTKSKLASFLESARGKETHRAWADQLADFFKTSIKPNGKREPFISYSHLSNIEQDRKTPNKDKFIRLATEFVGIDKDAAISMWVEQKRIVDVNRKFANKIKKLEKK